MRFFLPPSPFFIPAASISRKGLYGLLILCLFLSPALSHAAGRRPRRPADTQQAQDKSKQPRNLDEDENVPVEEDQTSTGPAQDELDKLLSGDGETETLAEAPQDSNTDPARAELEKLLASDESKNFWEDTKKLFESIPQSVEVKETTPQKYSYSRAGSKQSKYKGSVAKRLHGWPTVDAASLPPGAKVQKIWIWQETADCLWNIAKEYYGNPYLWPKIYEANKHLIKDPNVIFPKQQIIIPPLETSDAGAYPPSDEAFPRSRTARRR